jgi:tetratricopeptide (TPR) repeat protein
MNLRPVPKAHHMCASRIALGACHGKSGQNGLTVKFNGDQPLKNWKEIAAFFGKDERTVKRWEVHRGLPVRRLPGPARASVFAYPSELESWLKGNRDMVEAVVPQDETPAVSRPATVSSRPRSKLLRGVAAGVAFAVLAIAGYAATAGMTALKGRVPADIAANVLSGNLATRDLYLEGMYHLDLRSADGLNRAARNFTEAVVQDPQFAAAYAGLANAYNLLSQYTLMPPAEAYPLAKSAAERALAIDPDLAQGYAALAFTEFYWTRDFARSRQLFEKALELQPDSADTNHWYALVMMQMGEFDIALKAISHAQQLNPSIRSILANKGLILYHAGRLDEAEKLLTQFAGNAPDYVAPHFYLADLYFDRKRYGDQLRHALEAARIQNNAPMRAIFEAARSGYRAGGREGLLAAMLAEQKAQYVKGAEPAYKLARTEAFMGDTEAALGHLASAIAAHEQDTLGIWIDSAFRGLRGNPRFMALVEQVGYSPTMLQEAAVAESFTPETAAPH